MIKSLIKLPLLIALIFFFVSLGAFFLLLKEINFKNTQAVTSVKNWQIEEYRRNNVGELEKLLTARDAESKEIESHFVKNTDVVKFLDFIERLAPAGASAEVTLIDVPKDGSGLAIEVRAKGSFESLYKFLSLIESSPYELEVSSMGMKYNGFVEGSSVWNGTFKIKLLSFL